MPRTALPPTPASSTDISGQDGSKQLAALQMAFELPEPAMTPHGSQPASFNAESPDRISPKTAYPVQPAEAVKSRRRSSAAARDAFALPPPPTRSRKIIQMKPRPQDVAPIEEVPPATTSGKGGAASSKHAPAPPAASSASGVGVSKKKQVSTTSAAGRKIARKTAHSLIERRRRSKMNEEFAVLKNMIPACTGEMHKLSILQASIEYVKYLEECVEKLKADREVQPTQTPSDVGGNPQFPSGEERYNPNRQYQAYLGQQSPDVEMTESEAAPSPTNTTNPCRSQQPSISPALLPQDLRHRHDSYSSVSTDHRHYSYSAPATTSPAFGPQVYGYAQSSHSGAGSTLTSPALGPQRDMDQEATAALLMLNSDRRGTSSHASSFRRSGGMSVRDLLSS